MPSPLTSKEQLSQCIALAPKQEDFDYEESVLVCCGCEVKCCDGFSTRVSPKPSGDARSVSNRVSGEQGGKEALLAPQSQDIDGLYRNETVKQNSQQLRRSHAGAMEALARLQGCASEADALPAETNI